MSYQLHLDTETVDHAFPAQALCVEPGTTVRQVFAELRQQNRGCVLVCRDGKLIGIFTERDALKLMAEEADLDVPVEAHMTSRVLTLSTIDTVGSAIQRMASGGYRRMPIVDKDGRPIGVLGVSGILHYLVEDFPKVVYTLPPQPHHTMQQREGA